MSNFEYFTKDELYKLVEDVFAFGVATGMAIEEENKTDTLIEISGKFRGLYPDLWNYIYNMIEKKAEDIP